MRIEDLHRVMTSWAPKEIAWEKDNVGIQVGDMSATVNRILVSLDVTEDVIAEARQRKANVIVSHHPLLFRPPKAITPRDEVGRCIRALIASNIHLYSAHTNLDFTRDGTSFALAGALGLQDVDFLHKNYRTQRKIVTFVPEHHVDKVRTAMAAAGAGTIGNYDQCSFGMRGTGSFRGNSATRPAVGKVGTLEHVPEVRLEMIANEWNTAAIVHAMRSAHPYEEIAYDVYPLENASNDYGMGIIGTLKRPMHIQPFLTLVKKGLHVRALRRTESPRPSIRRVAACGGSGSELLDVAIGQGADAFITADVKYHDFHHATGRILLVDAGHYETEHLVVHAVVKKLKEEFFKMGTSVPVFATKRTTNPIFYS